MAPFLLTDVWQSVYAAMSARLKIQANVSQEIVAYVGNSTPKIVGLPLPDIENGLSNGTIDIGMCGLFITQERIKKFDFASPFYLATGLQAVIKLRDHQPTAEFMVNKLIQCIDGKTLLILIDLR